jgi:hypothetical protein
MLREPISASILLALTIVIHTVGMAVLLQWALRAHV